MRRTLPVIILLPLLALGTVGHGQVYDIEDGAFENGILTENDNGFYEDEGLYDDGGFGFEDDEFGFEDHEFGFGDDEFGFEDDELGLEGDRFGFDAGYAPYDDEYGVYQDDVYGGYGVYDYDDLYDEWDEFGLDEHYWDEYLTADDFDDVYYDEDEDYSWETDDPSFEQMYGDADDRAGNDDWLELEVY